MFGAGPPLGTVDCGPKREGGPSGSPVRRRGSCCRGRGGAARLQPPASLLFHSKGGLFWPPATSLPPARPLHTDTGGAALPLHKCLANRASPAPPRRLSCPSALILSLLQKAVQKRRLPRAAARAGGAAGQGGKQAAFEGGGATPPSGGSAAGAAGLASAWNCFAGVRPAGEGWNLWKGRGGHRMRGEGRDAELSVCPGNGESDDLPDAGGAGRGFPGRRGPVSTCPPGGRRARSRGRGVSARGGSALV